MRQIALACLLFFGQTLVWAAPKAIGWGDPSDPFYDAKIHPLPAETRHLLMDNHYFVHSDGSIWAPLGKEEIRVSQMRVLIRRLKSSERLKALLNIDLILSKNDSRHLTPDDFNKMRHILKLAWPYFTLANRKHFARYFPREELYSMNATPPDDEADPDLLAEAPLGTPPQASDALSQAAPSSLTTTQNIPTESVQGGLSNGVAAMPELSQSSSFFPQASQAQIPIPAASVVETPHIAPPSPLTPQSPVVTTAPPTPVQLVSALSPLSTIPAAVMGSVASPVIVASAVSHALPAISPIPNATVVSTNTVIAPEDLKQILAASSVLRAPGAHGAFGAAIVKSSAPVSLSPLEPASLPSLKPISIADVEKFLLVAPYSADAKGLLRLIASNAQEPFRSRALTTAMTIAPAIVLDSESAGLSAHEKVIFKEIPGGGKEVVIALNPAPIISFKREFLFEEWRAMIPSSSSAYKTLGLPVPHVEALDASARPEKTEAGPWGQQTQIYSDNSRRGNFSSFEMAGFLLHSLLELQAQMEGWSAFPYQEQSYAYSGQMLLYAQIKDGTKTTDFLDPQTRALFEDWLNHPARFHDFIIHSLASGQNSLLDLRHIETSRRDYFIRQSYIACPQSLKQAASLSESSELEALKKGAMSLARAHLDATADFKKALNSLDSKAAAADLKYSSPSEAVCAAYWQKEFRGSSLIDSLLSEAADAESEFRKKTGALYVP
jgi:hypothetical protein